MHLRRFQEMAVDVCPKCNGVWLDPDNVEQLPGYPLPERIRTYAFSAEMLGSLTKVYPHLTEADTQIVARALRQFFMIHAKAPSTLIGMPSKVVDELWHEFILDTRAYRSFCQTAFGSFFHHVPASAMNSDSRNDEAMLETWHYACLEENINPRCPIHLPLLFAIDAKLSIPGAVNLMPSGLKVGGDRGSCGGGGCGGGCGGG